MERIVWTTTQHLWPTGINGWFLLVGPGSAMMILAITCQQETFGKCNEVKAKIRKRSNGNSIAYKLPPGHTPDSQTIFNLRVFLHLSQIKTQYPWILLIRGSATLYRLFTCTSFVYMIPLTWNLLLFSL